MHACNRCGEAFAKPEHLALHVARLHPGPLTVDERAGFEAALKEEEAWLIGFRQRVRGGLAAMVPIGVTFFVVLLVYVSGSPLAMTLLLVPPALGFAALAYILTVNNEL